MVAIIEKGNMFLAGSVEQRTRETQRFYRVGSKLGFPVLLNMVSAVGV